MNTKFLDDREAEPVPVMTGCRHRSVYRFSVKASKRMSESISLVRSISTPKCDPKPLQPSKLSSDHGIKHLPMQYL